MSFDPSSGQGGGQGGWPPGPLGGGGVGPPAPGQPAQGGWGQPAPGQPAQGGWGQPAPGQPAQGSWGQPAPGQPTQGGWGAPQPGYPGTYGASPGPGASGMAPTNPWFPAALVSFFLPGIGLLLLSDKKRTKLAIAIFATTVVGHIVLSCMGIVSGMFSSGLGMLFSILNWFFGLVMHIGSAIHTHDETVRSYPQLGRPILFEKPIDLPPQLQD